MKKCACLLAFALLLSQYCFCWGFFAHRKINYYAVFLLPPPMLDLYKSQVAFITEHAVDPDKRRYVLASEAMRHFIDIDHYGAFPFDSLPRKWNAAIEKFGQDSLEKYGIAPWWIPSMLKRLTDAFRTKDQLKILQYSAEIGHYIADIHVPLHASSNHNGQLTDQRGIHAFWESRVPELLAENGDGWDFFIGPAEYIKDPSAFIWKRVLESAAAADTVLKIEKELSRKFSPTTEFAFEDRNGTTIRQYSSAYTIAYNRLLKGMIERRMRQSIFAVASFWYTAWINAGQPDLSSLSHKVFTDEEQKEFERLNDSWKNGKIKGREE
jgi:hypothetical protein